MGEHIHKTCIYQTDIGSKIYRSSYPSSVRKEIKKKWPTDRHHMDKCQMYNIKRKKLNSIGYILNDLIYNKHYEKDIKL